MVFIQEKLMPSGTMSKPKPRAHLGKQIGLHYKSLNHLMQTLPRVALEDREEKSAEQVKKQKKLKARGSKTDPSKFVEYWVPVPLSNVQLEHYCATLLDDTTMAMLCSPWKKDGVGVLSNIHKTVQKCCDHPYLVDQTLQPSIMKEFAPQDLLNVRIKASGKLQLLDMILSKCRRPKLKVLILYQSFAGSGGIGNILDDYMRQKYGENSYGRLESSLIPSKRQETLVKFHDKEGEQFVLLLEHRACSQSVKLLQVDFVIIFNTELSCPANEVKDLHRISIAQTKQIKVFRLYSCHTLEEKILILAKRHKIINILQSTNRTMSDNVLMWGASVLFERLDKFHAEQSTSFSLDFLSGQQSLLDDIVKNFMDKIINDPEVKCEHGSMISRALFSEGVYHVDKLLLGEKDVQQTDEGDRQLFWKNILEGRKPCWKFCEPTSKSRKRGTYDENSETATKHQKVVDTRDTVSNAQPEVESGDQDAVQKAGFDQPTSENDQTSLHEFLKDEMEKLCLVLQLSMDIKQLVGAFLEYVIKNHQVNKEPASILHAFQLSTCWAVAKILKKHMDKRETLLRAKSALQFQCTEEEAYFAYAKMRALKKTFQQLRRKDNPVGSEATGEHIIPAPQSSREEMVPSSELLSEAERGDNNGPSVEQPAASQNVLAPVLAQLVPNLAIAEGPSQLHVNPMHHIGSRISALAPQSLQSELDYLRKYREEMIKQFDSKKSSLMSECEREMLQIRKKYEEKQKEAESAMEQGLTLVDSNYNVASMHKTLSDVLQFKCSDGGIPGNSTTQQGLGAGVSPLFTQQMHQGQARLRHHSPAATLSSTSHHPTAVQQNAFSPSTFSSTGYPAPSIASSSVQSHRSSGPFAGAWRPHSSSCSSYSYSYSSITPSVSSTRVGGVIRCPTPHLQPYRPPANIFMPIQLMAAPSSVPANQPPQSSLWPMELLRTNAPENRGEQKYEHPYRRV